MSVHIRLGKSLAKKIYQGSLPSERELAVTLHRKGGSDYDPPSLAVLIQDTIEGYGTYKTNKTKYDKSVVGKDLSYLQNLVQQHNLVDVVDNFRRNPTFITAVRAGDTYNNRVDLDDLVDEAGEDDTDDDDPSGTPFPPEGDLERSDTDEEGVPTHWDEGIESDDESVRVATATSLPPDTPEARSSSSRPQQFSPVRGWDVEPPTTSVESQLIEMMSRMEQQGVDHDDAIEELETHLGKQLAQVEQQQQEIPDALKEKMETMGDMAGQPEPDMDDEALIFDRADPSDKVAVVIDYYLFNGNMPEPHTKKATMSVSELSKLVDYVGTIYTINNKTAPPVLSYKIDPQTHSSLTGMVGVKTNKPIALGNIRSVKTTDDREGQEDIVVS